MLISKNLNNDKVIGITASDKTVIINNLKRFPKIQN